MKMLRGFCGALLLCLGLSSCTPQADFYVAVTGDDANPGTQAKPFATVARARDAVRQLKKTMPQRKKMIIVQVGAGTYLLKEPLVFTPEDSGTPHTPVFYVSDLRGAAILSGGKLITDWREVLPGRWETTVPDVAAGKWNFAQLYINDQRRPRPVLPKDGYYFIAGQMSPTHGQKPDQFRFKGNEFRADWRSLGDVEVTTFHLWTMDRLRVKAVDAAQHSVTFTGPTHSLDQASLARTTWYRIENVREALTQPGEWYLDRRTGVLTVLALPGEDLNKARVIAPRLTHVVQFAGRPEAPVRDIVLHRLTMAHNAWNTPAGGYGFPQADVVVDGAVTAYYTRHCVLDHCIVRHTGSWAVDWGNGCHDDGVLHCELFDLGIGGIKVGPYQLGWEGDTNKWASGCVVRDNLIAHGGRVLPAAVGVWIGHADHNIIAHNEIKDFYYSGMSVGWRWGAGFSPAHHNLIAENHIHDIGQGVLSDMGGIYTLGESPGTVLRGNCIHDVNRARYGGWAIYFDEGSSNIVAENNLVYRTQDAGSHQNYGRDNCVRNNIFALGTNGEIRVSDPRKDNSIRYEHNLFYGNGPKMFENENFSTQMVFRSNLYWRAKGEAFKFIHDETLDDWRKHEPDAVVADPLFVAPEQGDFHLKSGSPARQVGFVAFDASQAGRTTKMVRTASLPSVLRVFPPAPSEDDLYRNLVIDDDFESYPPGQPINDFKTQTDPGDVAAITTNNAAGGRQSLQFRKGPPGPHAWTPHIFTKVRYTAGVIQQSFDIWVDPGACMSCEWRDWPAMGGGHYKTGPAVTIAPDGTLRASGLQLLMLPHGAWIHLAIRCALGASANGSYSLAVTLPGQTEQRFDGIHYQAGFKAVDWMGFSTHGKEGTQYFVDNLKLGPADQP